MPSPQATALATQIQWLLNGDAWHGPNLEQLLDGMTATMAAHRPPGSAHAIQDLLAHIDAWHREVLAVVGGRAYRSMPDAEQWPGVTGRGDAASRRTIDDAGWRRVAESIFEHGRRLSEAVARLDDAALARPIEERD